MSWQSFPGDAPKDRDILVRGKWRDFDIHPGGARCVAIAYWGTIHSNGTDERWYINFLCPIDHVNVDFTEWMDIPE